MGTNDARQSLPTSSPSTRYGLILMFLAWNFSLGEVQAAHPLDSETILYVVGEGGRGWSEMLEEPRAGASRLAQAMIGDAVLAHQLKRPWVEVTLTEQHIKGWMREAELVRPAEDWQSRRRYLIIKVPGIQSDSGFLPFGTRLPAASASREEIVLLSPNGTRLTVDSSSVRAASVDWPKP